MELVGKRHHSREETVKSILMVNHHAGIVGGGELSMLQLMDGLKERNVVVALATSAEGELAARARAAGHPVFLLPMPPIGLKSLRALAEWKRMLRQREFSLIHAQTPRAAFYAGAAGRRAAIPSLFHCRVAARDWKLDPILVRLVDRIVCNSRATAARFEKWPWLEPAVIYNGLDVAVMPAMKDEGESGTLNLLFIGRLSEEKQPEIAWQVFSGLAEEFPNLNLVFVGDHDHLNPALALELKRQTGASPYQSRVIWAGLQPDISPWLAMADVVIMPSRHEGFGRVLVEAMAHGVPPVAFRVGGIPEVVEEGRQGVLVEPYDVEALRSAVAALLKDGDRRRAMGEAGLLRAAQFSLAAHVQAVLDLYRSIEGGAGEH